MLKTFRGGIHPPEKKEITEKIPSLPISPKDEVIIPLRQHIGAPCEPIVSVGDYVYMGQKIGESTSFVSAPVHSSVSGTVKDIKPYPHPTGGMCMSIIIENDHKDTLAEGIKPFTLDLLPDKVKEYVDSLDPKEIVSKVKEAGITGMGGASFPLHVKLSPPPGTEIDTVVLNGAECEPYLTSDHRAMLEHPKLIICGASMIKKAVNAKKILMAIENNKPDAIALMQTLLKDYEDFEVVVLKTKYPQGSEKQLINAVTGRQVPSGGLPSAVGVVVSNVDTCSAVADAVVRNMPLIRRNVTISGDAVANPANLIARVGMKFEELFEAAGGLKENPEKIIMGGPMMGMAQTRVDVPMIKGTSGILALSKAETFGDKEGDCIKCGKCVGVCPMRLMPNALTTFAIAQDMEKLKEYNILDCMECGSCTFICPQKRFIVQHIKKGKQLLK